MNSEAYAIIAMVSGNYYGVDASIGEVVNRVMWDGVSIWMPPSGTEARADPNGTMQIGQIVTP